jgi:uncharacterized membrane protein/sporulation protein YlmC with PRC-barrel domain
MIDIPISAKVECADGTCGESVTVIVNPVTRKVTHVVVQDQSLSPSNQRLVPMDQVLETTSDLVRLRCTQDELAAMVPFVETHFIKSEPAPVDYSADYVTYILPYALPAEPTYIPVEEERIPLGHLAVRRGTIVEATDGYVGRVGELLVDPEGEQITHLVLQEGHLWGKKEITLPLAAIDHVSEDTVYLKLDKQSVELLPVIPVKRRHFTWGADIELVAKVFDDPEQASEALKFVEDLHRRKTIRILNAAVLVKDEDGATSLKDTRDIDPKKGRLLGAVTGGLIGLLAGPGGAIIGALAGAGTGGAAAKRIDMGFSDEFLANLQKYLQPGSSALIVLVEHEMAAQLSDALAGEEGVIVQQTLTDRLVEGFLAASEEDG